MSAYKIQMLGNYPEESIQHSEHSKSFKSRILLHLFSKLVTCLLLAIKRGSLDSSYLNTANIPASLDFCLHIAGHMIQMNSATYQSQQR